VILTVFFYALAAFLYLHQWSIGYPYDPSQVGGFHHETFIELFMFLGSLALGWKVMDKIREKKNEKEGK